MKSWTLYLICSLVISVSSSIALPKGDEVKPTVFLLLREPKAEIDWYRIFEAALQGWEELSLEERVAHPYLQNVIILDEQSYWTVVFCAVGNGRVITERQRTFFDREDYAIVGNSNFIIHLDKDTLTKFEKPRDDAVSYVPYTTTNLLPVDSGFFRVNRAVIRRHR